MTIVLIVVVDIGRRYMQCYSSLIDFLFQLHYLELGQTDTKIQTYDTV